MKNATTKATGFETFSVTRNHRTTTVRATVGRVQFEYTRFLGGAWEVYDHPKSWGGTPRFVGYLPAETGRKLEAIARL